MATPQSKIVQDGIKKVEAFLRKGGYIGALDLNTIVKDDKFYGLEWTARFGYDAIYALAEIIDFKLLDLFHCMSTNSSFRYRFTTEYGAAVRVSIPPYPEGKDYSDDIPIQGLNSENLKHIWVGDMRFKDGMFYTAGADGVPLVVSAKGVDVKEATRRCYRTISNLRIPDMQYRTDIGKRVREQLQKKWIF
jgi:phosphoribosylamine-glycine ligase